ncbi:hypothetical protein AVEN_270932-1 [Araneus ventricosus]|uniref:Uncharacterized protein n=1 Tax=Araneus ventricosus TaxID=182803 RepID=A0A4Y2R7J7_ARAVE|nr:hypothetical protein AVEN_270932-1 [Araneus ventricosus]
MPLDNLLLNAVSAGDPSCRQHSLSLKLMKDLPTLATNAISVEKGGGGRNPKVYRYHVARLRQAKQKQAVDNWWVEIENSTKVSTAVKNGTCSSHLFSWSQIEIKYQHRKLSELNDELKWYSR